MSAAFDALTVDGFTVTVDQNRFLPDGATRVDAIVTVGLAGGAVDPAAPRPAQVLVVDCSGSMDHPSDKFDQARAAVVAAVDTLHDGVDFAIVAGANGAMQVYPPTGLAPATARHKRAARAAVRSLRADGGTRIGRWLRLVNQILAARAGVRHVILLTDGRNQHESRAQLDAEIAACEGRFTCDCRGVGTEWEVDELRRVSSALLGGVDIVADPADLANDFRAMARRALGRTTTDVTLRLWTPQGATLHLVKQVSPTVEDLTGRRVDVGSRVGAYPLGSWGAEQREYHIGVDVPPGEVGTHVLAARASVVTGGVVEAQGLVLAEWSADERRITDESAAVRHYRQQQELVDAVRDGLAALRRGEQDIALELLGRAMRLAGESGNTATTALLRSIVEVEDPVTGALRLRTEVTDEALMTLDARGTHTVRIPRRPTGEDVR